MITCASHNIFSPLGFGSAENYAAVKAGRSALCVHEAEAFRLAEPFVASMLAADEIERQYAAAGFAAPATRFEKMALCSAAAAMRRADVDAAKALLVISTTKGNISLLDEAVEGVPSERVYLAEAARFIARQLGICRQPVVVSNACISGVCALQAGMRALADEEVERVVVVGADAQCRFIISGFQSFKALSAEPCKPFDAERAGLNLGDGAATMVLGRDCSSWQLAASAVRNDANHISGPSRTGEGSYRALMRVLPERHDLAFINAHGTATAYNDEMESCAIERAGLRQVPVGSLKGYYGHTMGAAGVLETIISMLAIEDGTILPTRGFGNKGVSHDITIADRLMKTDKREFIKLISGFGGCNAALLMREI